MGGCFGCCGNSAEEHNLMPSAEERRQKALEAAERRIKETQSRGLKDPDKVRRQMQVAADKERRLQELGGN